jgi:hypothetical protein
MTLQAHVNNSGFPLQIAIAQQILASNSGWQVLYQEHYWKTDIEDGFIDLAIENSQQCCVMNIECKRVRDSQWIFLVPNEPKLGQTPSASIWWTETTMGSESSFSRFGWHELSVKPISYETCFCAVPGQDTKSRPMLERVAVEVASSTYALAVSEAQLLSNQYSRGLRFYLNAIVTTASLQLCTYDPSQISLATGDVGDGVSFQEVPFIRFRKQLGAPPLKEQPKVSDRRSLERIISESESTIFVINAQYLSDFLSQLHISGPREHQWMR